MIEVKEAVSRAMQAFSNMVGQARAQTALLEEVEMVRDNGTACWAVTISEPVDHAPNLASLAVSFGPGSRDYKVLKIDAESGAFVSMKIRKI